MSPASNLPLEISVTTQPRPAGVERGTRTKNRHPRSFGPTNPVFGGSSLLAGGSQRTTSKFVFLSFISINHNPLGFNIINFWISRKFEVLMKERLHIRPLICWKLTSVKSYFFPQKSLWRVSGTNKLLTFLAPKVEEHPHHRQEQTLRKALNSAQHLALCRSSLCPESRNQA